ncbi:DNA cytosine methyltransferase [Planomonospora sp. ID82291]|uniref:DNA cytosine methyltransferase n=1 Tax=Planomonospora sp. ID82291 TaxID=2738136 RepID=UPI0018C3DF2B|nr:DNA cytosine methyltransferase [Planomonospora sp. ID82291]MBG0814838.1 DNA cytosine methyltransferase [Planomonospora sp. ID82291]
MTAGPDNHINIIDLFAGCGGFTQGFHEFVPDGWDRSPFRTVGAVEWDMAAATTYAANFAAEAGGTDHIFPGDIKDWNPGDIDAEVDVILGGPPCQGFSGLGKEDPEDPRNKLWREYIRVVKKLEPKLFVIENVDRFFISDEYAALREAADGGELKDYVLQADRLVAADYGVPQARKRTIVLATRRDLIEAHPEKVPLRHPAPTHFDPKKYATGLLEGVEGLTPWVPVRTVFGEPGKPTTLEHPVSTELPSGRRDLLGKELPGPFRTTELHIGRNPTKQSIERYMDIPPGGNRHDIAPARSTESWMRHRSGSHDVMGRMYLDRPSVTIRTEFYKPEKGRYLHPWAHRPITHYEAARLQGFPEEFLWYGSKTEIARQIGNAVPVDLSRAIARQVHDYLRAAGQMAW